MAPLNPHHGVGVVTTSDPGYYVEYTNGYNSTDAVRWSNSPSPVKHLYLCVSICLSVCLVYLYVFGCKYIVIITPGGGLMPISFVYDHLIMAKITCYIMSTMLTCWLDMSLLLRPAKRVIMGLCKGCYRKILSFSISSPLSLSLSSSLSMSLSSSIFLYLSIPTSSPTRR